MKGFISFLFQVMNSIGFTKADKERDLPSRGVILEIGVISSRNDIYR